MYDRAKSPFFAHQNDPKFLISNDVQTSFYSRYFDPVDREFVLGREKYLGRMKRRSERLRAGHG